MYRSLNWKGSGAMNETLDAPDYIQLEEVRLHLSAAGGASENFEVTINSHLGTEYDLVLKEQDMNAETDVHYQPTRPVFIHKDDKVDFTYTNTNSKTWGLEVLFQ
jgi:hypothetical protein